MVKGGSPSVNPAVVEMTAGRRALLEESLAQARERIEAMELEAGGLSSDIAAARAELLDARASYSSLRDSTEAARSRSASLDAWIEALRADVEGWTGEVP